MRTIPVSTDVYAALWARRKPGQESEDEILRDLLGVTTKPKSIAEERPPRGTGFYAANVNVHFPEGFEIFRNYRHRDYRAKASGGRWILENDGQSYPSLHKLSWAVVQGHENSWNGWKYRRQDGSVGYINEARKAGRPK